MKYLSLPLLLSLLISGLVACNSTPKGADPRQPAGAVGAASDADGDDTLDPQVAQGIGDLFQQILVQRHGQTGPGVKRAGFLKLHGCAKGTFEVAADLPVEFKQGLFSVAGPHDAWLRLSSDTTPKTPDAEQSTIGFGLKVLTVPGRKILSGEEDAQTQDFLLQNHPVFFVDNAQEFLEFTEAALSDKFDAYSSQHPRTMAILEAMKHDVQNVRQTPFYSSTPYHFGDSGFAKYKVVPCASIPMPDEAPSTDPNFLQLRMQRDFKKLGACFEFQVQRRLGDTMPVGQATVLWSEEVSKPVTVATLRLPPQDPAKNMTCENYSFNPFHALPAHRPAGSVNEARGLIYKRLSEYRRTRDGLPLKEP